MNAVSGAPVWAERYDCSLTDVFAVQGEVTRSIVPILAIRLEDESLAVAKRKAADNLRAYDYWLRGKNLLDFWQRSALSEARRCFERAIEIDPGFARAYSGLGLTYLWMSFYSAWNDGVRSPEDKAEQLALKAAGLDPTDHQPHVALGWIYQARRDFDRAGGKQS